MQAVLESPPNHRGFLDIRATKRKGRGLVLELYTHINKMFTTPPATGVRIQRRFIRPKNFPAESFLVVYNTSVESVRRRRAADPIYPDTT
jgi:hypothetical protein